MYFYNASAFYILFEIDLNRNLPPHNKNNNNKHMILKIKERRLLLLYGKPLM